MIANYYIVRQEVKAAYSVRAFEPNLKWANPEVYQLCDIDVHTPFLFPPLPHLYDFCEDNYTLITKKKNIYLE